MNLQSYLLLGLIAVVAIGVGIRYIRRQKRTGGCGSCQCSNCEGCPDSRFTH